MSDGDAMSDGSNDYNPSASDDDDVDDDVDDDDDVDGPNAFWRFPSEPEEMEEDEDAKPASNTNPTNPKPNPSFVPCGRELNLSISSTSLSLYLAGAFVLMG